MKPFFLTLACCVIQGLICDSPSLEAQSETTTVPIDFGRDVLPLFRTHCIDCHGPKEQKNGFRLDRRSDAMRGGTLSMIGPGNAAASLLYLRLTGDRIGPQMPPDGPLTADEIDVIRRWIDEGAKWPDELAGDAPPTIPDPRAVKLMDTLREGDHQAFVKLLQADPGSAKLTGPGGSTPLMYATIYSDIDDVRRLLDSGADVNARNDSGVTALMWAVQDLAMTKLLIERGADVNASSNNSRTPLIIASGRPGGREVSRLLLERGADPSVVAPSYRGPVSPLRQAADLADETLLQMLLERGARVEDAGPFPYFSALVENSRECVDRLMKAHAPTPVTVSLTLLVPPFCNQGLSDVDMVRQLIQQGADVNARDRGDRTVLMLAVSDDSLPVEAIKTLLEHGADVNAKAPDGRTALDFAMLRGPSPVVELLQAAGARSGLPSGSSQTKPSPASTVRAALDRSLPLIQKVDELFLTKTGCVSCHHNTVAAMTIGLARQNGLPVNQAIARKQRERIGSYLEGWRERTLQDSPIPGGTETVSDILVGLAAENFPPDPSTDAQARYLLGQQASDGHWHVQAHRPPLESSDYKSTANCLRSLQVYGIKSKRTDYDQAVQRATDWLKQADPSLPVDRAYQLLGLCWAGCDEPTLQKVSRKLRDDQRPDGGWNSLPALESDAFSTGQVLVALHAAGLPVTDPAYQRGVKYLMSTQLKDGSWFVRSRSVPFQPYFESGFPHGEDQWISAAATNWAVMALIPAAR